MGKQSLDDFTLFLEQGIGRTCMGSPERRILSVGPVATALVVDASLTNVWIDAKWQIADARKKSLRAQHSTPQLSRTSASGRSSRSRGGVPGARRVCST